MDVKKIVLLVGALIIAAVTAVMAKNMFSGASAPQAVAKQAAPAGPEVLVATRPLPVGTIINAEAFRYQPWPQGLVQDAYFIKGEGSTDPASLIGTVVRTEVSAGQPVTRGALIRPGERGFLAAALGPGMRAVTVAVSDTSGVNGFVFPGDRVDIVLTQEVAGGEGSGPPLRVSETIIRNIRVLAVDRRINARDAEGNQVPQNTSTVTFEATPQLAEQIAVAQTAGALTLSLRALADNSADLERAIATGEVDVPEGDDPQAERQMIASVAQPTSGHGTYTVGGDVSRFQRRTIPRIQGAAGSGVGGETTGPVVRIARGNTVETVSLEAR